MFDGPISVSIPIAIKFVLKPARVLYNSYYKRIKKHDFIFDRYSKEVRIFPDGHGIVTTRMAIKVLNINKFTTIRRNLKIQDAAKNASFDTWDTLTNISIQDRYSKLGFWWKGDEVVQDAIPLYNSDRKGSKHLRWKFVFEHNRIKDDKIKRIHLSYGFSIPGMYPITNGKLDPALIPYEDYEYATSLKVEHKVNYVRYVVAMDRCMEFEETPSFRLCERNYNDKNGDVKLLDSDNQSNIFLHVFVASKKLPKYGQRIKCTWKMK